MENDFLVFLNILGCQGSLNDEVAFAKALEDGPKSLKFTKLIHILAEELKNFCHLKKSVSVMNSPDESSSFLLELSSFLEEIGCPYKCLIKEDMSSYLQSKKDCVLLLDFLISELMAVRIVRVNCPQKKQSGVIKTVMQKSQLVKVLKDILILLKFKKPPPNITSENLFRKIAAKLEKEGDKLVGKPLYNKMLSEKDWRYLNKSYSELYVKYQKRRETLITRLENTMQSFECSDRLKDTVQSVYRQKREALKAKPSVKLSDVLAARTSLLRVKKTCAMENTKSKVCKGVIERGDHSSGNNCSEEVRMQGSDGYSQADGLDQARPQTSLPASNQNQHNHQTCEVPSGGYNQNGGYDNREGGFDNQGDNQNIGEPNQGLLLISGQATTEAGEGDNSASNGCGTSLGNISTQDESGGSLGIYSKEEPAEVTFLTLEGSTDNKPDAMDAKPLSSGTDASPLVAQDISALPSLKRKKITGSAKRRRARLKREAAAANGPDKIATTEAGEGDNSASNGCGTSQGNTSTQHEIGVSLGDYSKEGLAEVISRQLEGSTDNKTDAMDGKPLSSDTDAPPLVAQDTSALPPLERKKVNGSAKRRRARLKREAAAANGPDKIVAEISDNTTDGPDETDGTKRLKLESQCDGPLTYRRMAIVSDEGPKITAELVKYVKAAVFNMLVKTVDYLPRVEAGALISGALYFTCYTDRDAEWLCGINGTIVKGVRLRVVDAGLIDDAPKLVKLAWKTWDSYNLDLPLVLAVIQRYNPELNTGTWKVLDTDEDEVRGSVRRIVLMDQASADVIKAHGYRLHAGVDFSIFKFL